MNTMRQHRLPQPQAKLASIATKKTAGSKIDRLPGAIQLTKRVFRGNNAEPVAAYTLIVPSDSVDLFVGASEEMNRLNGFQRGTGGAPYFQCRDGRKITDPRKMRIYCRGFLEHFENIASLVGRDVLAVTSFGDNMTNEGYLLATNDGSDRILYCRGSEEARIAANHLYYAIGTEMDGNPWAGRIRFSLVGQRSYRAFSEDGEDLTDLLRVIITGPPVVWNGKRLSPVATAPRWSSDLRHLFTLISCPTPAGPILIGESELMADRDCLRAAAEGIAVTVRLIWKDESDVEHPLPPESLEALLRDSQVRGYNQMASEELVHLPGQFTIDSDCSTLTICLLPGRYPHNVLGIDRSGDKWINVQVRGVSTRSGADLKELAALTKQSGADFAIALDQGADPQLAVRYGDELHIVPSFTYRSKLTSVIAWVAKQKAA